MAKSVLFIHSAGPQGRHQGSNDFVAILKKSLGSGYDIRHPKMPSPEAPDYKPWRDQIEKEILKLAEGSILIGHSLGGSFLLKYLSEEKMDKEFLGLFIVAAPYWGLEGWEYEAFSLKKGFSEKLNNAGKIFIYHTLDDQIVSRDHLLRYAKSIPHALVREVDGFGHAFNAAECKELIQDIKAL